MGAGGDLERFKPEDIEHADECERTRLKPQPRVDPRDEPVEELAAT
jgi:hypothetical protein